MTRTASFTDLTSPFTILLPALTFVAGLATAQFIATGDRYDLQDAAYGDHPRRGARSVLLSDDAATVPVRADAVTRRGKRPAAEPDQAVTDADSIASEVRDRLLARR